MKEKRKKLKKGVVVCQTVSQLAQQARPSPSVVGAKDGKPRTKIEWTRQSQRWETVPHLGPF